MELEWKLRLVTCSYAHGLETGTVQPRAVRKSVSRPAAEPGAIGGQEAVSRPRYAAGPFRIASQSPNISSELHRVLRVSHCACVDGPTRPMVPEPIRRGCRA